MESIKFTVKKGLEVQKANLAFWRKILHQTPYRKLRKYVTEQNKKLTEASDGYNVFRGNDFDCWIHNNLR